MKNDDSTKSVVNDSIVECPSCKGKVTKELLSRQGMCNLVKI